MKVSAGIGLFIFIVVIASCSQSKESETNVSLADIVSFETEATKSFDIEIPIAINVLHRNNPDIMPEGAGIYNVVSETDAAKIIDIKEDYYTKYTSGKRFKADSWAFYDGGFTWVENLNLSLDIVNNTDQDIDISSLDVIVSESKIDSIPVIHICTTENYSNTITFANDSWFDWGDMTFFYSLLKEGEKFDGNYKKSRKIPYFEDEIIVDLLPDMKELGYNLDGLIKAIEEYNNVNETDNPNLWRKESPWIVEKDFGEYLVFAINQDDPAFDKLSKQFAPFGLANPICEEEFTGVAILYGSLTFSKSNYKVDFIADISLSTGGGFGAGSFEDDHFDVKLKTNDRDYSLSYPYTTVIRPNEAEYITLSLSADKSSNHKFHIRAKNNNGMSIRSKDVYFHHYIPKSRARASMAEQQ